MVGVPDQPFRHAVFALEPGIDDGAFILEASQKLGFQKITITAAESPFAAALAASRGESVQSITDWSDALVAEAARHGLEADAWIVNSNTGYSLCDAIQGMNADLLIIRATTEGPSRPLPLHMDWALPGHPAPAAGDQALAWNDL